MILEVDELTHSYGDEPAVETVSFGLESGERVALLGPSGCGKTTVVQAIAGHISPSGGRVVLRGEDVTSAPPESRNIGVVFQQSTLFPHLTVGENVAYGLAPAGVPPAERDSLVSESLELVDLGGKHDASPETLSGGEKRRVELARALAPDPDLLVLDEPLSALDRALRERLREEIARIQRETGVTMLAVTHDQTEAMALADRLVVMNDGTVSGSGEPRVLYESPPTPFVASFLGRSNILSGTVLADDQPTISLGETKCTVSGSAAAVPAGETVTFHFRPADASLSESGDSAVSLSGDVTRVADFGRRYDVTLQLGSGAVVTVEQSAEPPAVGECCHISLPAEKVSLFGPDGQRYDGAVNSYTPDDTSAGGPLTE